jgi:hypothetical protein
MVSRPQSAPTLPSGGPATFRRSIEVDRHGQSRRSLHPHARALMTSQVPSWVKARCHGTELLPASPGALPRGIRPSPFKLEPPALPEPEALQPTPDRADPVSLSDRIAALRAAVGQLPTDYSLRAKPAAAETEPTRAASETDDVAEASTLPESATRKHPVNPGRERATCSCQRACCQSAARIRAGRKALAAAHRDAAALAAADLCAGLQEASERLATFLRRKARRRHREDGWDSDDSFQREELADTAPAPKQRQVDSACRTTRRRKRKERSKPRWRS